MKFTVFLICLLFAQLSWTEVVRETTEESKEPLPSEMNIGLNGDWCAEAPFKERTSFKKDNTFEIRPSSPSLNGKYEYDAEKRILILRNKQNMGSSEELVTVYILRDDGRIQRHGMMKYDREWQRRSKDNILKSSAISNMQSYFLSRCTPLTS